MRKLTYTLLVEGIADNAFISRYLQLLAAPFNLQPIQTRLTLRSGSKSKVYNELVPFCNSTFTALDANLFIAGVDLDARDVTDELSIHSAEVNRMKTKLGRLYEIYQNQIILFVPIQALDCWILYQKYKIDGNRYNNNGLESKDKDTVKKILYGDKDANRRDVERSISQIMQRANFDELASQSKSFKIFHTQIKTFIENF